MLEFGNKVSGLFNKLKNAACPPSPPPPPPLESNPIMQLFDVGEECTSAGPGLAWKVHNALRKSDGKECSVFILEKELAEKVYRPTKKKKEKILMLDCIRHTVHMLEEVRHPKMLQVIHPLEEGETTIAFASEPILASLHDILAWQAKNPLPSDPPLQPMKNEYPPGPLVGEDKADRPPKVKDFWFVEMEIRYGLLQIVDALCYLHYNTQQVHRNVSPHVILVCKRGNWKLFGLDFLEKFVNPEPTAMIQVPIYNMKTSRIAQPHLDYMAPEAQMSGRCNMLSDMFSLGLIICCIFNQGKPLIQAQCNPLNYIKQIEKIDDRLDLVWHRIPESLHEAVSRLLSKDPTSRPTTLLLPVLSFFKCKLTQCDSEPAINALQFLDVASTKDSHQRTKFYKEDLMQSLPHIPDKLLWMHVWPSLQMELLTGEVVAAVIVPIVWLTNKSTQQQFNELILPILRQLYARNLMSNPKLVSTSIAFLENLHVWLQRCNNQEVYAEMVPLIITALDNIHNVAQQTAALIALQNCTEFVSDQVLHLYVLVKVRALMERNSTDVKIINLILCFYEKVIYRLERQHLIDYVIPTMLSMRLNDATMITRVVKLYKIMVTDTKFGLTSNIMAKRMLPTLAPQAVNPTLTMEQYHALIEILYDMLASIDEIQRPLVANSAPGVPRIERTHHILRHRQSTDYIKGDPPPFSIPNLRVDRGERKISSAEDMARKASIAAPNIQPTPSESTVSTGIKKIGQWLGIGNSGNSNNNDNNFLRVVNVFPNRRLSDNTLLVPTSSVTAPSSSSSPGGTPGAAGLPPRRHSSQGPQERRGSHLSPPTVSRAARAHQNRGRGDSGLSLTVPVPAHTSGGSMPNAATSSVPFLGASNTSVATGAGSRRPSGCNSRRPSGSNSRRPSESNSRRPSESNSRRPSDSNSRRPSACPSAASRVSHASAHSQASASLLQQLQSGVVRRLPQVPPRPLRPVPTPRRTSSVTRSASRWLQNALSAGNRTLQDTISRLPSLNTGSVR